MRGVGGPGTLAAGGGKGRGRAVEAGESGDPHAHDTDTQRRARCMQCASYFPLFMRPLSPLTPYPHSHRICRAISMPHCALRAAHFNVPQLLPRAFSKNAHQQMAFTGNTSASIVVPLPVHPAPSPPSPDTQEDLRLQPSTRPAAVAAGVCARRRPVVGVGRAGAAQVRPWSNPGFELSNTPRS